MTKALAPIFDNAAPIAVTKTVPQPAAQSAVVPKAVAVTSPRKEEPAKPKSNKPRTLPPLGMSVRFGAKKPVVEEKKEVEVAKVADTPATYGNQPVKQSQLNVIWEDFAKQQGAFLQQTLLLANPTVKDNSIILIHLENSFQHDKLNEVTQKLMPYLRSTLQNDSIKLEVSISAALESHKAFTPKEKLELLMKGNPALVRLIDTMGLEMD